ncbi:MAG: D-alanine--D-alanine ligase, partial [Anaerovoracaceae bacterium]
MGKKKVLIIFGGTSSEHDISCLSAAAIVRNIDKEKYLPFTLGITKEGRWLLVDTSPEKMEERKWQTGVSIIEGILSPDRKTNGVLLKNGKVLEIDCVLPILHGKWGEDGTIQGLLEVAGLPYVGCGVLSSSICMDKAITKQIVSNLPAVNQAKYYLTTRYEFANNTIQEIRNIETQFQGTYPLFVKPANAGSSVGITKAHNNVELIEALKIAAKEDSKILIEETIVGREIEVAVLGNHRPQASGVGEI